MRVRSAGFTLIEVMVVIVVLAISLGLGIPAFSTWITNTQIRAATDSIQNGLQLARAEAVRTNARASFVASADGWSVLDSAGGEVQKKSYKEGAKQAVITFTPGAATTVTFNGLGRVAANEDGSAPITQVDVKASASKSRPLRVTVGSMGVIRLCDPNADSGSSYAC